MSEGRTTVSRDVATVECDSRERVCDKHGCATKDKDFCGCGCCLLPTYGLRPSEAVGEVVGCAVLVAVDARGPVALVVGDLQRGGGRGCQDGEGVQEGVVVLRGCIWH